MCDNAQSASKFASAPILRPVETMLRRRRNLTQASRTLIRATEMHMNIAESNWRPVNIRLASVWRKPPWIGKTEQALIAKQKAVQGGAALDTWENEGGKGASLAFEKNRHLRSL